MCYDVIMNISHLHGPLADNEFCFVLDNGNLVGDEVGLFFQCLDSDLTVLPAHADMADILIHAGIFRSRSQAKKDQKWGNKLDIPSGFTHLTRVGKRRRDIAILNPTPDNLV